jgi:hypothetical protein
MSRFPGLSHHPGFAMVLKDDAILPTWPEIDVVDLRAEKWKTRLKLDEQKRVVCQPTLTVFWLNEILMRTGMRWMAHCFIVVISQRDFYTVQHDLNARDFKVYCDAGMVPIPSRSLDPFGTPLRDWQSANRLVGIGPWVCHPTSTSGSEVDRAHLGVTTWKVLEFRN